MILQNALKNFGFGFLEIRFKIFVKAAEQSPLFT